MTDRPKKPTPPDGEPKQPAKDRDGTTKSKVAEVQYPLIAGDVGKVDTRVNTGEAKVDEAGQLRRKKGEVDLLH